MEVVKNLTERDMTALREVFEAGDGGLSEDRFVEVLTEAGKKIAGLDVTKLHLRELFSDIDINGDGTASWEEFTMFIISAETANPSFTGEGLRQYQPLFNVQPEIPNSIGEIRYIPSINKLLQVIRRERFTKVEICNPQGKVQRETPRTEITSILSADYVSSSGGIIGGNSVVVSNTDGELVFYDYGAKDERHAVDPITMLSVRRVMPLPESQTVVRWSGSYRRLFLASRSGIVSALNVDDPSPTAHITKERIHMQRITDMSLHDSALYTASVDARICCVDLHRGMLRFAINTGGQEMCIVRVDDDCQQLFASGLEPYAYVYSLSLPKLKPFCLIDASRPHRGRLIGIETVRNSPQVITADASGMVKVWDIRTMSCFQTITPTKESVGEHLLNSIGVIPSMNRLMMCGRDTKVYGSEVGFFRELSDDEICTGLHWNPASRSFLTIHNRTFKLWDSGTGCLRGNYRNAVDSEVSAVCLAAPRYRKFFAGTVAGDLYSFGYAICSLTKKIPSCSAEPSEVVSLTYMDHIRDNYTPYLIVAYRRQVVLLPDTEERIQRSTLTLHSLRPYLEDTTVKCLSVAHAQAVVGTANGWIYIVDLVTYDIHFRIPDRIAGDIVCLRTYPIPATRSGYLGFAAGGGGDIVVLRHLEGSFDIVHQWSASGQERKVSDLQPAQSLPDLGSRPSSAVKSYFTQNKSLVYSCSVSCLAYIDEVAVLVTGDEMGIVSVWDVRPILEKVRREAFVSTSKASSREGAIKVEVVFSWRAHRGDVTALCCLQSDEGKWIVATTGEDRCAFIWSLDGVLLGDLCQGRTAGEAPKGGIHPFLLDTPPANAWNESDKLAEQKDRNPLNTPQLKPKPRTGSGMEDPALEPLELFEKQSNEPAFITNPSDLSMSATIRSFQLHTPSGGQSVPTLRLPLRLGVKTEKLTSGVDLNGTTVPMLFHSLPPRSAQTARGAHRDSIAAVARSLRPSAPPRSPPRMNTARLTRRALKFIQRVDKEKSLKGNEKLRSLHTAGYVVLKQGGTNAPSHREV